VTEDEVNAAIDRHLGLHQELRVYYVVDGYKAILEHEEAYGGKISEGYGQTVIGALRDLAAKL
jgi:hypothetical protein